MQSDKMKGFTLIELLVVISIIGFFASIVMSSLQSAREKTYDAEIQTHMSQIKTALELYASENNFTYPDPQVEVVQNDTETFTVKNRVEKFFSFLIPEKVYAQSSRNKNCVRFDNLSSVLVPKYIGQIPRHPLDDGFNVCYQYFKSQSMNTAVAYGPLVSEKYSEGNSKQVGVVLGEAEVESLMAICTEILEDTDTGTPYPLFTDPDHCSGEVADDVLGVVEGEGDVALVESCSIPERSTEEECAMDYSACSDDQYTSAGQDVCVENGVYEGGYCIDHPEYESESACINAEYEIAGSCDGGPEYTEQAACENAQYLVSPGYCDTGFSDPGIGGGPYLTEESCVNAGGSSGEYCTGSGYNDAYSCTNATGIIQPGYCSNPAYTDQYYCESEMYESSPGYCDLGYSEYDCVPNGGVWTPPIYSPVNTWTPDVYGSLGFQWISGFMSYGYTWVPDQFANYNYQWTPGTSTPYNYEWDPGTYVQNEWIDSPPGVWDIY